MMDWRKKPLDKSEADRREQTLSDRVPLSDYSLLHSDDLDTTSECSITPQR